MTAWCPRTLSNTPPTLQAAQSGPAPILIRIETKAGHGAGKPTAKIIEETADKWAFVMAESGNEIVVTEAGVARQAIINGLRAELYWS